MSGYTLSKSAVTKTARTVKQFGTTPLSKSKQSSRRINSQNSISSEDNIKRAIIVSGSNGIYNCNIINEDGTISTTTTTLVASRATAYNLAPEKRILGGYFPTITA